MEVFFASETSVAVREIEGSRTFEVRNIIEIIVKLP